MPSWSPPVMPTPWRTPWPRSWTSPGWPAGPSGAHAGPARKTWLDDGWAWASHWSMERLAEWYEARYDAAVVRAEA